MKASSQTATIYERIRADILSFDLMPGEKLTERGLESTFGASRTPARAALIRLETEGLVQRERRGWLVAPIDLDEIEALGEFREAAECAALRLAVDRASPSEVESVAELLEAALPLCNADEGVRAGGEFHIELARLSDNVFLVDAVKGAMIRLARTRWLEVRTEEAQTQAWREHRAIIDALRDGNAEVASELMAEHIRGTNDRLLAFLKAERRPFRARGLSIVSNAHSNG